MIGRIGYWRLIGVATLCMASCVSSAAGAPKAVLQTIKPTDTHIISMGRYEKNADGSVRFGYPGVTFSLNFYGKQLSIDAQSTTNKSYLEVIVDNENPQLINLSTTLQTYPVVSGTVAKRHHVEVVHRTETWIGIVTIKQFVIGGKLIIPAPLPKRKILVLGDSITCGEAIDRVPGETKDSKWWNPRQSYGMLLGKLLNAQVQLVCMGGHGLIRTWDDKTNELNLPDFYQLTIADQQQPVRWDQTQYDPNLIISAIGTNDFSQGIPDKETYVSAYAKFLSILLADHQHAQIVVTESAILNGEEKAAIVDDINASIARVDNQRVHHVVTTHFPGDAIDAHPTREQHAKMAAELSQQIKKIMNW